MFKTRDINPGSWRPHRNANTLGQLIEKRMVLLVVCRRCKHEGLIFPADLIPRFGTNYPAVGVRRFLRCSSCRVSEHPRGSALTIYADCRCATGSSGGAPGFSLTSRSPTSPANSAISVFRSDRSWAIRSSRPSAFDLTSALYSMFTSHSRLRSAA
jgi:hypothetical protein